MKSHFSLTGRVAMACAVSSAAAMLPQVCSSQIAADNPGNAAYLDGWQAGDNGGFGFSPWGMNGTYNSAVQHSLNSTSPYNPFGTAWTLYNPLGVAQGVANGGVGTDISRAGRGFAPLQIGQTISATIANPTEQAFFKGYTIRLVSGGHNTSYGDATAISRLAVGTFEYFTYGRWYAPNGGTSLFDTNTTGGMRLDVTLTGANSYSLTMTPLLNPGAAYTESGTLAGTGAIDWIQFELYNTDSDFYPAAVGGAQRTDFYVGSMTIVPEPSSLALIGLGTGLLCLRRRT